MKNKYFVLILCLLITGLYSCEKNSIQVIDTKDFNGPFFRAYNFAPAGPTVNVTVNDVKVTAIGSTNGKEAVAGIALYGIFPGTNSYVNLKSKGSVTIKSVISSTAVANPGAVISTLTTDLEEGKFYSFFTCGLYNSTAKTTESIVVEDLIPAIDTSAAYMRFINLAPNTSGGVDLSIRNRATSEVINITAPILFKGTTQFVKIPAGIYDLTSIFVNGSTPTTVTRTELTISKSYVYNIIGRGSGAASPNQYALDMTRNR